MIPTAECVISARVAEVAPELMVDVEIKQDASWIVVSLTDRSGVPVLNKRFSVRDLADPRELRYQAGHAARALAYSRRTGMTREPDEKGIIREVPV